MKEGKEGEERKAVEEVLEEVKSNVLHFLTGSREEHGHETAA